MSVVDYKEYNFKLFKKLSECLNNHTDFIKESMIKDITSLGFSKKEAFKMLFASLLDFDIVDNREDQFIYNEYFDEMIELLKVNEYLNNDYYKNISFNNKKIGNCELKYDNYKPYEAFIFDDIVLKAKGKQIPKIGFFDKKFIYPAVYENNRLWMSVTPNEINTMKDDIDSAFGNVLTFGLGLGYFQYMCSLKENVRSIVIVEKNKEIIRLFSEYILKQFEYKDKITIINIDAFKYLEEDMGKGNFDYVYVDLWHDVSDGLPMYEKIKGYEYKLPMAKFRYWIEKSMLCYK